MVCEEPLPLGATPSHIQHGDTNPHPCAHCARASHFPQELTQQDASWNEQLLALDASALEKLLRAGDERLSRLPFLLRCVDGIT